MSHESVATFSPQLWPFLTTREAAWHIISVVSVYLSVCISVCLFVCLSDDNFRKPWRRKFIYAHPLYLREIWVMFVYKGHRVTVKVTRAKKGWKSLSPQCKTSIGNNSGSIKHRAMKFACSVADWMADCHLCHVTGSDHA